ncbi:MAG: hypothetical protein M1118_06840, partial [Chloroflexi bacterium]|nr:hypothetical protein [Chloroflexota bacterium]
LFSVPSQPGEVVALTIQGLREGKLYRAWNRVTRDRMTLSLGLPVLRWTLQAAEEEWMIQESGAAAVSLE